MDGNVRYTIGVDLGQIRNHTALAVLERRWIQATASQFISSGGRAYGGEYQYTFVGMERLALGTDYPRAVQWVKTIAARYGDSLGDVVVDATGAGNPVMDLFKRAQMGVRLVGTVVVGSGAVPGGGRTSSGYQTVARLELLTGLQVAVQMRRFSVSKTKCREWESWVREMELMRFEGKRAGVQDDLAFATALAVWWGIKL